MSPIRTAASVVVVLMATAAFGLAGFLLAAFIVGIVGLVRSRSRPERIVAAAFLILVVAVLFLSPLYCRARESARIAACRNNVKQIGLAMLLYREAHGHFPPAYTVDADGKPMHSWRVLILPYLEEHELYDQYDFAEAWDGPNNRKLVDRLPHIYRCLSRPYGRGKATVTNYVAITGPKTSWCLGESDKERESAEVTRNTIMVAEIADSDILWTEPRDISFEQAVQGINTSTKPCLSSRHVHECGFLYHDLGGVNVVFANGMACFLPEDTYRETLESLLIAGVPESFTPNELIRPRLHLPRCITLGLLVIAAILLLILPRRKPAV